MPTHEPPTHDWSEGTFEHVLARAQAGDEGAMEELFRRFYPTVERMVHASLSRDVRVGRPWLHARFSTGDVVQEVFRGLLGKLASFRGATEDAFCGYLAMVVRNRLVDAVRFHEAAQRDGRRTQDEPSEEQGFAETEAPPDASAEAQELVLFQELLGTFDEQDQLLLRGRLEQDISFTDLAARLGYSSRSAAQRAFYAAQARLAILIRQRGGSPGD